MTIMDPTQSIILFDRNNNMITYVDKLFEYYDISSGSSSVVHALYHFSDEVVRKILGLRPNQNIPKILHNKKIRTKVIYDFINLLMNSRNKESFLNEIDKYIEHYINYGGRGKGKPKLEGKRQSQRQRQRQR